MAELNVLNQLILTNSSVYMTLTIVWDEWDTDIN